MNSIDRMVFVIDKQCFFFVKQEMNWLAFLAPTVNSISVPLTPTLQRFPLPNVAFSANQIQVLARDNKF
jgi:hypothetical protein